MQNDMLLARPYARAWFLCGQEAQLLDEYASCLEVLADCVLTPKVQHLISNPTVMLQDMVKLFETVLAQQIERMSIPSDSVQGLRQQAAQLMQLLAQNKRLAVLPAMRCAFLQLVAKHKQQRGVSVRVAFEQDEAAKLQLQQKIKQHYGADTDITYTADHTLIGGVQVSSADEVTDYSVADQLRELARTLKVKNFKLQTESHG